MEEGTTQGSATRRQTLPSSPVRTDTLDTSASAAGFTKSFIAGLPPVPTALSKPIQREEFVDMAELTVDYLSMLSYDETNKSTQTKKRPVTSIIEWGQCFTQYIAILTQAKPERTTDLLGYQHLILQAHLEYDGDGWMVYDRRFR